MRLTCVVFVVPLPMGNDLTPFQECFNCRNRRATLGHDACRYNSRYRFIRQLLARHEHLRWMLDGYNLVRRANYRS